MEFEEQRGLYHPVSLQEASLSSDTAVDGRRDHPGAEANFSDGDTGVDDDVIVPRLPLEISNVEEYPDDQTRFLKVVQKDEVVVFPSLVVSMLVLLTLAGITALLFRLIGRMFVALPFFLHSTLCALSSRVQLSRSILGWKSRFLTSTCSLLDIVLLGMIYPKVWNAMIDVFFTDVDGTVVIEWTDERFALRVLMLLGQLLAFLRLLLGTFSWLSQIIDFCILPSWLANACYKVKPVCSLQVRQPGALKLVNTTLSLSILGLAWALYSVAVHFYSWPPPSVVHADCDPMDETECWLPFPSMEFMKRDPNTTTGWRVHLQGNLLPPLKGRISMDPAFLNELDGFSTMGSILFYMEGLKEAHEAGVGQLQGPTSIAASVTPQSITVLLDVNSSKLVAHSAEIDYLDSARPLVMVFPAQPLMHGIHYALAVVNATDEHGNMIAPSAHLTFLTALPSDVGNQRIIDRANRYLETVIPALERAAPWLSVAKHPDVLQMLFDFVTVSEDSQLGPVRAVRDAALAHVSSSSWGAWSDHVRLVERVDNDCSQSLIARTIHAELDVPWFLDGYGRGHRGAVLDRDAISQRMPTAIGTAKFVLHIPCSLRHAALGTGDRDSKPLRAVMEYGHGLFYNRQEASEQFLLQMAHDEGYVIMAMDWRGMSVFDLLVVAKVLLSRPRMFQAVRDNLIQGYANKFALLHFSQNGMLSMDWFRFEPSGRNNAKFVPTLNNEAPVPVFYGISQGGILGAGYVALSGATGLLDRAILGVPGTPFALIMTRSLDFVGYDLLLLLNFYENRHVRELLALVQMAWDSVEGSGVLAPPIREPIPRMLLQAGLGDAVVPSIAAEALARGLNASVLSNNPRSIYNIPVADAVEGTNDGPSVVLTELLYEKEYASLPVDDTRMEGNSVHVCVRRDPAMIRQISEFINSGQVLDVCARDACRREHSC